MSKYYVPGVCAVKKKFHLSLLSRKPARLTSRPNWSARACTDAHVFDVRGLFEKSDKNAVTTAVRERQNDSRRTFAVT